MTGDVIKSRDGDFQFQRGPLSQSEPRRVRWPYMNRLFYKGKMLCRVSRLGFLELKAPPKLNDGAKYCYFFSKSLTPAGVAMPMLFLSYWY
jgi:hypothetical protein